MMRTNIHSPSARRQPAAFGQTSRELFTAQGEATAPTSVKDEETVQSWRLVDRLLGAGSEDGVRIALQIAVDRHLKMGPALSHLWPSERPYALTASTEERRLFEELIEAARHEVRVHTRVLERRVDQVDEQPMPLPLNSPVVPSQAALRRPSS